MTTHDEPMPSLFEADREPQTFPVMRVVTPDGQAFWIDGDYQPDAVDAFGEGVVVTRCIAKEVV
jgi:hypothetical protein